MEALLAEIKACQLCKGKLPHNPNPVMTAHPNNKLLIIGQAPGTKVHESGIPWNDASGKELRRWLNLSDKQFYDKEKVGIIPMGFCYPGKGKSGDLPPRPECAEAWHEKLLVELPQVELTLLIGTYAQNYYLGKQAKKNLTETVYYFEDYLPKFLALPHPSPRNRFWMKKNPWFEESIVPYLQKRIPTFFENH
jgi:uracil-DNA glycosylase